MVEQFGYKEKHYADGTPLPRGRTEIRRCFNDMRPVAHLWAAFRLHHEHPVILHDELLRTNEGIRWLLHIARRCRDFARAWRPTREKKHFPLLSKIRGCCPDCIRPLKPLWTKNLESSPSWMIQMTNRYKQNR